MGMPPTKTLLMVESGKQRDALGAMLGGLSRDQMLWTGAYGWSAKDHVAHLAEWERLFFSWYDTALRGEEPAVPAPGFTWATIDGLNRLIYDRHRDDQLEHVMADWQMTSRQLINLAQGISEADLFTSGRYAWTGRGTLASFVYECGPNHYRWSAVEIKRGLKFRR
jgi:hypothetical protein